MLTREEARQQPCRDHIDSIEYDYHHNGDGVAHKIFHYHNCTANDCPKWVDIPIHQGWCPKGRKQKGFSCPHEGRPDYDSNCNDCPHRYGRCGS